MRTDFTGLPTIVDASEAGRTSQGLSVAAFAADVKASIKPSTIAVAPAREAEENIIGSFFQSISNVLGKAYATSRPKRVRPSMGDVCVRTRFGRTNPYGRVMKITRLHRGRALSLAGLLVAFSGVNVWASTTVAIYPGSHIDTAYMQQFNSADSQKMQRALDAETTVYASSDGYDKIYTFYKSRYKTDTATLEYMLSAMKAHPRPGKALAIPRAMFTVGGGSAVSLATYEGRTLVGIVQHK